MPTYTDLSLKFNYWFVSHRQQFRRWWFIVLVALDFLLVVYVAIIMTIFLSEADKTSDNIASMPRYVLAPAFKEQHQPTDLEMSEPIKLARGDQRYDIAVGVDNANTDWAATVEYSFYVSDELITSGATYLAPNKISYL